LGIGFLGESYHDAKKSNYYSLWKSILKRCSDGFQESYKNTYISKEWYNFTNFKNDINLIVGYKEYIKFKDSIKFEIDKDIFGNGELYSKETCCFVPRDINSFFKRTPTTNNSGVKGVSWDAKRSKWKAQCSHNGIIILNKRFDNKAEATYAYNNTKKYSLKTYLDNDYVWLDEEIKKQCISKLNDNKFW